MIFEVPVCRVTARNHCVFAQIVRRGGTLPTNLTTAVWGLGLKPPTVEIPLEVVPTKF